MSDQTRYTDASRTTVWQSCGGPRHQPGPWGPERVDGSIIHTQGSDVDGLGYCQDCPPYLCPDCGGMESYDEPCACWVDLTALAPSDVKAEMVADGWNVGTDGRLTR